MAVYDDIAEIVRASIRSSALRPGTVLLEGQLAEIFGSSRSPVKQALEQLLAEGLVRRFDGRGLVVGDEPAPVLRVPLRAAQFNLDAPEIGKVWGWQKIYQAVERDLVHHSVFGCFRVKEVELAAHYGVGRTVARDVLVRAHSTGLVVKDERAHWITVPLDERRLRDLFVLRRLLEPAAIASATGRIPAAALDEMRLRLDRVSRTYPAVTPEALDQLEQDLHVACVGHTVNLEVVKALRRTRCVIISSKHILGNSVSLPVFDPFFMEHDKVLVALAAGRAAPAMRAMTAHLTSAEDKVAQRLDSFRRRCALPESAYIGPEKQTLAGEAHSPGGLQDVWD
jgi:DNA-binding GntR family transcriptional regulator